MRSEFEHLTVERTDEHVLLITFDRPEVANAKNTRLGEEQRDLFESLYVVGKSVIAFFAPDPHLRFSTHDFQIPIKCRDLGRCDFPLRDGQMGLDPDVLVFIRRMRRYDGIGEQPGRTTHHFPVHRNDLLDYRVRVLSWPPGSRLPTFFATTGARNENRFEVMMMLIPIWINITSGTTT